MNYCFEEVGAEFLHRHPRFFRAESTGLARRASQTTAYYGASQSFRSAMMQNLLAALHVVMIIAFSLLGASGN